MLRKYGLRNDDIKDYHIRQKRKQKSSLSPSAASETVDQPTVLQTLRLLSAIEQFLGSADLGQKANILLAQAKNLETKGNSQSLLERQDLIDFLHECKGILMQKVQVLNEQQSKAARTCMDQISVLLQMSSLKPTEKPVLNLEKYGQDPLRYRIAQTIIDHYSGKIGQEELDNLVMSQAQRIAMPPQAPPPVHVPVPVHVPRAYQTSTSQPVQAPSANINWDALQNAVKSVNPPSSSSAAGPSNYPKNNPPVHPGDEEYDDLSLEELTSLFQNFNSLDKETQQHLVAYMTRLERSNPDKVTEFKRFMHSKKQLRQ